MPFAQRPWLDPKPQGVYQFAEEHRPEWAVFWQEMEGDYDKVLEFAKNAEIQNPEDWTESLHLFLFGLFRGANRLLKTAAKKSFKDFIAQVVENHIKDPYPKHWYMSLGITPQNFVSLMEHAAVFDEEDQAMIYLNARMPDFGSKLYSEYILSKTSQGKELRTIASRMNHQAYMLEKKITGRKFPIDIQPGDWVKHAAFPGEDFQVLEVDNEPFLIVQDDFGNVSYVMDVWNISF